MLLNEIAESKSLQVTEIVSRSPSVIFRKAVESGASNEVPFVLRQSFLPDVECHQFAFGNFYIRKARNRLGVIEAKVKLIIFDRESQPVSHKIDVALDRFRADFQFLRKFSAIGITTGFKTLMHAHHAFEGRTRIKAVAGRERVGYDCAS